MEPSKDTIGKLKALKEKGVDITKVKELWDTSTVEDEDVRAIQCGIIVDEEVMASYTKWQGYDLTKNGIKDIKTFWYDVIGKNTDKIKCENDAIKVVHEALVKKLRSASKKFVGTIIAVDMKRENLGKYIDEVLNNYRQDSEQVILANQVEVFADIDTLRTKYPSIVSVVEGSKDRYFIDGNYVIPIGKKDIVVTTKAGTKQEKKNWYGGKYDKKPVVGTSYMQNINVIVKEKDKEGSKYKWYPLTLNGDKCNISKPIGTMVEFLSTIAPDGSKLYPADDILFDAIGNITPDDYKEIEEVASRRELKFDNLLEYVNKTGGKSYDTKMVRVKVTDSFISDEKTTILVSSIVEKTIADMGELFDGKGDLKDNSMYCNIPSHIPIKFGKGSEIMIFGNLAYGSSKEGDSWITVTTKAKIWVNGILVHPDQQVEQQNINVTDEEINTDKWKEEVNE